MADYTREENLADAGGAGRACCELIYTLPQADHRARAGRRVCRRHGPGRGLRHGGGRRHGPVLPERERARPDPRHHQPVRDPRDGRARGAPLLPHGRALRRGRGAPHRLRARGGRRRRARRQGGGDRAGAGRRRPGRRCRPARSWCTTWPAARSTPAWSRRTVEGIADIRASDEGREGVQSFLRASASRAGCCRRAEAAMDAMVATLMRHAATAGPGRRARLGQRRSPVRGGVPDRPGRLPGLDRRCRQGLQMLQHPGVLAASGFMLFVEFFADKIPGVDSLWDMVHTVIRIPAGAALAAGVLGADDAADGAGRGAARRRPGGHRHAAKVTTRAAINTSPEPFSNVGAVAGRRRPGGRSCCGWRPRIRWSSPSCWSSASCWRSCCWWCWSSSCASVVRGVREFFAGRPAAARRSGDDVQEDPDRQPRRDRLPRRGDRAPHGHPHRRRVFRRRRARQARARLRRGRAHRRQRAQGQLPALGTDPRSRQGHRRARRSIRATAS